ncbi:MAG TPA: hypothetical protein VFA99_01370 [Acidobacteriaceae bacterium]|nr:hypothetical protein [Acidobacteriaceae bacterium]
MKAAALSLLGLGVSFAVCGLGFYGCTMHETSRWGQSEDLLTFLLAGLAYLGAVGAATAVTLFVRGLLFVWKKRTGLN